MVAPYEIDVEDVEFACPDGVPLLARLYRPRGPGPFPGVVEVHGGAWTMNDRITNHDIHVPLAKSGVVVMSIDRPGSILRSASTLAAAAIRGGL